MKLFSRKKFQNYREADHNTLRHRILLVDDEAANIGVLTGMLKSKYQILSAANGLEAYNLVVQEAEKGGLVSVIISDQRMPEMNGTEFFAKILDIMPHTKRIILTAYTDIDAVSEAVNQAQIYKFILKPYEHKDVELIVRRAIEAYEAETELDYYRRELEQKVQERTRELEEKNARLKQTREQLIMQEKMASMGTLSAGIAHELKNPMNFIANFTQLNTGLLDELIELHQSRQTMSQMDFDNECCELVDNVQKNNTRVVSHLKRAVRIINSMMDFVLEPGKQGPHPTKINQLLAEFSELTYHGFLANHTAVNISIARDLDESIGQVTVNQLNLSRVFTNLMGNALEAVWGKQQSMETPYPGEIRITSKNMENHIEIEFWDNGPGVSPQNRARIFDHFFTTKRTGSNIGLGLSISHEIIVREHGGRMELTSEEGSFTSFKLTIPKQLPPECPQ